ncbi:protocadherin Fat 1-like [Amphibalanus amphitrite]|uniref:protocadherin Fat 1-like n=1 Tax=Amphibalanus amphitrite TaxID=1232801 RepID=UPI001C916A65|nr:protocadherin Fat 1-like [Amphibalanus amphitrite]
MVDPTTGKVTLKKKLDREDPDLIDRGFINVVLQARESPKNDPDQACSNITCVNGTALITVNDLEDNGPKFENTSMQADFAENKTGNLDLTINVTDKDATFQNNYITLSLEGAQKDVFQLQQSSGSGQLQTTIAVVDKDYMDYEKEDHRTITLTVVATGSDPSSPTASATVTVHLTDVNDNSPQFAASEYKANVNESSAEGDTVVTVAATDEDSADFGSDGIRYSISGGKQNTLRIDPKTGLVSVSRDAPYDFDRDRDRVLNYTITAADDTGTGNTGTVTLVVAVLDVDDSPPTLDVSRWVQTALDVSRWVQTALDVSRWVQTALDVGGGSAEVLEETKGAEVPAHITADDADSMAKLEFSIDWDATKAYKDNVQVDRTEYDYTDLFQLSADSSGKAATLRVSPAGAPDREQMDTITLRVVVTDTATESGTDQAAGAPTVISLTPLPPALR